MAWLTTKEVAAILEVSVRAVQKKVQKGEWESKKIQKTTATGKKVMELRIDFEGKNQTNISEKIRPIIAKNQTNLTRRTDEPDEPSDEPKKSDDLDDKVVAKCPTMSADTQTDFEELDENYKIIAQERGKLCEKALKLAQEKGKVEAYRLVTELYNRGMLGDELKEVDARNQTITVRTFQRWIGKYLKHNRDCFALAPEFATSRHAFASVTDDERSFLLRHYLKDTKPCKHTIIKLLKHMARINDAIDTPSSPSTLRRFLEDYERKNPHTVALARDGMKRFSDRFIRSIERDMDLLDVGDVFVADGNVLNFPIIDPSTGKARRMLFIAIMDMRSRAIVGGAIAPTENTLNIMNAWRNSFLNWGLPKAIYQDNGKAFKSRYFVSYKGKNLPDLAEEFGGLFLRLGIEEHFATAYNAKAKPIERWFKTFNDGFERFLDCYTGASIVDKPARYSRNEKFLQKLNHSEPMTMQEAQTLVGNYISNFYHKQEHAGLGGKTPLQMLQENPCPADRKIETERLDYMLLKAEAVKVSKQGVRLQGLQYWHEDLAMLVGQAAMIKYDLVDIGWVRVYTMDGKRICTAYRTEKMHPMLSLLPDAEQIQTREELNSAIKKQRQREKNAKNALKELRETTAPIDQKIALNTPVIEGGEGLFENERKQITQPKSWEEKTQEIDYTPQTAEPAEGGVSWDEIGV